MADWGAIKKSLNSDIEKPLNLLLTEKTNIKIQHVYFGFSGTEQTRNIDEVDISKSVIIPTTTGAVGRPDGMGGIEIGTLSYSFVGNSAVKCQCSFGAYVSASAMIVTFGASVL